MIKSYASYFVSYLIENLKDLDKIKRIILFGSVAKDESNKESDIDIFIELKKPSNINSKLEKILEEFYSSRISLLYKTKGIKNKINIIVGDLNDYKDLKESIESTGIVLYGNYISESFSGKKYVIIYWDKINKNRGAFLNKIYGFRSKDKKYLGLIEELGGRRIGKSSVIIPIESSKEFLSLSKKYGVNARIIEVYSENILNGANL